MAVILTMNCAGQLSILNKGVTPTNKISIDSNGFFVNDKEDTLCFPISVIRKVLIAAEQKKLLEQQVTILNDRIANYQIIISNLNEKDSITVAAYEKEIALFKDEKAIYQDQIKSYDKLLKRQKRKTFFTAAGGILATGLSLYLYLQK